MVLFHPDARDSWSTEVIGSVAVYVIICSEVTSYLQYPRVSYLNEFTRV